MRWDPIMHYGFGCIAAPNIKEYPKDDMNLYGMFWCLLVNFCVTWGCKCCLAVQCNWFIFNHSCVSWMFQNNQGCRRNCVLYHTWKQTLKNYIPILKTMRFFVFKSHKPHEMVQFELLPITKRGLSIAWLTSNIQQNQSN